MSVLQFLFCSCLVLETRVTEFPIWYSLGSLSKEVKWIQPQISSVSQLLTLKIHNNEWTKQAAAPTMQVSDISALYLAEITGENRVVKK